MVESKSEKKVRKQTDKSAAFKNRAELYVQRILDSAEKLGALANRKRYSSDDAQWNQITTAINGGMQRLTSRLEAEKQGKSSSFSLR